MPQQEALIRQLYVRINGTALETAVMDDLYAVEVDSNLALPAMCVLRLHDGNAELTNNGPFDLGAELVVGVGDPQGRGDQTIFSGEITGIEPDFGEGMVSDLTVRAYDRSHRLHRGAHTETYLNMSDSDMAAQIARAVGLQAEVDASSPTYEHVYQDGQTHMAFLRERARRIGYDLYVADRSLCFKRPSGNGSPIALEWGVQLRAFRPVLSLAHQVSEVQVRGWDPKEKREVIGQADRGGAAPRIGERQSGGELAGDAFGSAGDLAVQAAAHSQSEADTLAQARLDQHDGAFVEAEGTCVGQPDLKAGCLVELSALGRRFNGRYRVTSATHVWDTSSDYVTHFRVTGRRADSLRALLIEEEAPRPRWNAMIALVTNNDDPEGMGRVKVKFPWLSTDIESDWARLIGLGAGDQRGLCILPEVNDEVLVVFAQGDIAQPLVIGGLWNGSDALPASSGEIVAGGQVKQRLFVTRAGHKLTFSDENSAAITLETAGGHKVLLDDDAAKIEITGSGGNKIVLDENGRKLTIEGIGDVQIEASMNLTVKSSANMNLEAGGTMTIKGAVVQLN
jgi:phage protein D/phage baseplate assembly protein gpV